LLHSTQTDAWQIGFVASWQSVSDAHSTHFPSPSQTGSVGGHVALETHSTQRC
jgi:hypothetical protein